MWRRRAFVSTVLVLLVVLGGCVTAPRPPAPGPEDLKALYNEAIDDSAIFRADRQVSNLRQITKENVPVVMGSFMNCQGCSCGGQDPPWCAKKCCLAQGAQMLASDVWVSMSDQVYGFCSGFPQNLLPLRMQQLLGIPPQLDKPLESWKFLVVRIDSPAQLFRPCADPDPSTTGPCPATFPSTVPEKHRAWIAGQALFAWQRYTGDPFKGGYPWTRLGYTYNWNPAMSIVGTSEFVIPGGTQVEVCGVVPAAEFCAPGSDPAAYCAASR